MKTKLCLILIVLVKSSVLGQFWLSPSGDGIVEWDYSCHDSYTHDICFGEAAFDMGNLITGKHYLINLSKPSQYSTFETILEPSDHDNWDGEEVGVDWEWLKQNINYETLGLILCGRNENLIAGSTLPFNLTITPQYGTPQTAQVNVKITYPYYISGPGLVCSSPATFNLEHVPLTYTTVSWRVQQGSTIISSGTGSTASANISLNGNYNVSFTMAFACGLQNLTLSRDFHFGPYSSSDYEISGPSSAQCKSYVYYTIPDLPNGYTSINWTFPQNWTYVSGQGTRYLDLKTGTTSGVVAVGVNNSCGQSGSYDTQYTSVYGFCGYSLKISPNPANDIINISIIEPDINTDSIPNSISRNNQQFNSKYKIIITDRYGKVFNEFQTLEKNFNFPVQHLKQGNYFINVSKMDINFSSQFVISR